MPFQGPGGNYPPPHDSDVNQPPALASDVTNVALVASVSLTAQGASIGSTKLLTPIPGSVYLVAFYVRCSTAGQAGDKVVVSLAWTDNVAQTRTLSFVNGATVSDSVSLATVDVTGQGTVVLYCSDASNVNYATTLTNAGGLPDPVYTLVMRVIKLS